jgi:hypothetical protein
MDYQTFAESNAHSRRSVDHLVNLARNRVDSVPAYTLFVGAGASVTSGVRAASTLMEEWRRARYASAETRQPYEVWLKTQDWFDAEDEYSQLFELVYDQPSQRRAFIENVVKGGRPSWGYAYLTSLIEGSVINTVFTTNFDDLINEACFQFGMQLRPLVCAHDSAVNSIRLMSERPKIVKLHGDFLYDSIKNTSSELSNLETNMRDKFMEFAREFGMIVVGYSGCDKSVMDVLSVLARSQNCFRNGVYWCVRPGTAPGSRLRQLLRNDRIYWLEIDGFDELMAGLAHGLGLSLPLGVTAPHQVALNRSSHLFDGDSGSSHPLIHEARGVVGEMHQRICGLLSTAGLLSPRELSGRPTMSEVSGDLEAFALPFIQAQAARDQKEYEKAESILRQLLIRAPNDRRWSVLHKLLDCLLDSGGRADDIKTLLSQEGSAHGSSDELARCAYYALFVNEPTLSLQFSQKALVLNAGCSLALVNKGLAHLQLDERPQVNQVADTLVAPRMQDRFRAAGYAMTGDLQSLVVPLQRAFALGEYQPKLALHDVAFRPYWELSQFLDALRPFSENSTLDAPRRDHYPMSDPERKLREDVTRTLEAAAPCTLEHAV